MASPWNPGLNFQPESYGSGGWFNGLQNNSEFTFVDFFPACLKSAGVFKNPVYESFRTLIDRANDWLRTNRQWDITTCESVEFCKPTIGSLNSDVMTFVEYGESGTGYIRGLRLWLTRRKDGNETEKQIGYLNMVPQKTGEGGLFHSAQFEALDEVIGRFNSMMRMNPYPGRIINIETQEMKAKEAFFSKPTEVDPDCTSWVEYGDRYKHFLFVIRIFYEITDGYLEEIGLRDFSPVQLTRGGVFSFPEYEPFFNVMKKASDWWVTQQGIRLCNVQSIEMKTKGETVLDTRKMNYSEYGNRNTYYIRILRVAYVIPRDPHSQSKHQFSEITCRPFAPFKVASSIFLPKYETLQQTKERVAAWVRATGARVLSAETSPIRIMSGNDRKYGAHSTFTFKHGERNTFWLVVLRLYLQGTYNEPPPEVLPPAPIVQSQNCVLL